jgi:hypothetical protein
MPAQIGAPARVADRRRQAGLRIFVAEIDADGAGLADHFIAVADGGHFSHRIDRQVFRRLAIAGADVGDDDLVGLAQLLQKVERRVRARIGAVVERDHVGRLPAGLAKPERRLLTALWQQ